jgi:hypothetical protein
MSASDTRGCPDAARVSVSQKFRRQNLFDVLAATEICVNNFLMASIDQLVDTVATTPAGPMEPIVSRCGVPAVGRSSPERFPRLDACWMGRCPGMGCEGG